MGSATRIINGREVVAILCHWPGTWSATRAGNWAARCLWCGKRLYIRDEKRNDWDDCEQSPMARALREADD